MSPNRAAGWPLMNTAFAPERIGILITGPVLGSGTGGAGGIRLGGWAWACGSPIARSPTRRAGKRGKGIAASGAERACSGAVTVPIAAPAVARAPWASPTCAAASVTCDTSTCAVEGGGSPLVQMSAAFVRLGARLFSRAPAFCAPLAMVLPTASVLIAMVPSGEAFELVENVAATAVSNVLHRWIADPVVELQRIAPDPLRLVVLAALLMDTGEVIAGEGFSRPIALRPVEGVGDLEGIEGLIELAQAVQGDAEIGVGARRQLMQRMARA